MKFLNEKTKADRLDKIACGQCIPGQVYEFIQSGEESEEFPAADRLRICSDKLLTDRSKRMVNLDTGHTSAEQGVGNCRVYLHRPDIHLAYEVSE